MPTTFTGLLFTARVVVYIFIVLFPLHLAANEVTVPFHDITINANLEMAPNKKLADGVIIITHAGLAHRGMELYIYLQSLLKDRGYNSLAVNFSLAINNRHGMYDCKKTHRHHYRDAADEIGAWVSWLKQQGVNKVVLLGHSRGAAQAALFAAEQDNALLTSIILLAPDTQATNDADAYQRRYKTSLTPILAKARQLVARGRGKEILEHTSILYCKDTSVAAETFVSYYGPDPSLDTPFLIPKIVKPTLIIIAGSDDIVVGSKEKFIPLSDSQKVTMKVIDGAGHFFRDLNADDAVDLMDIFLHNTGFATR